MTGAVTAVSLRTLLLMHSRLMLQETCNQSRIENPVHPQGNPKNIQGGRVGQSLLTQPCDQVSLLTLHAQDMCSYTDTSMRSDLLS